MTLTADQKKLVSDNIGLVHTVAKKFPHLGMYDDRVQDGYVALCRAAQGFDPNMGRKFSTYAVPAIRHEIVRQGRAQQTSFSLSARAAESFAPVPDTSSIEQDEQADEIADVGTEDHIREVIGAAPFMTPVSRNLLTSRLCLDGGSPKTVLETRKDLGKMTIKDYKQAKTRAIEECRQILGRDQL